MLLQPLMAAFTGTGMFGFKALRITCNTYTCIHAKVGSYWLLVELIILSAIFGFYCAPHAPVPPPCCRSRAFGPRGAGHT